MDTLFSTRNLLLRTLNQSQSISSAIDASSCNLQRLESDLHASSVHLRSLHHRKSTLSSIGLLAEHASGPASAYSSVSLLQRAVSVSDPSTDLSTYLVSIRRLEQALAFLTKNCALSIHWLNDVVSHLDESSLDDEGYVLSVKRSLYVLEELKSMEAQARRPGGILRLAMDKLQVELRRIFETEININQLEDVLENKVYPIVDRMRSNGRELSVGRIYIEARISVIKSRIMELEVSSSDIGSWLKDIEFAVKQLIQIEHDLCRTLISDNRLGISIDCYGEIIAESGFLNLLNFGNKAVSTKKDAIKLLRLLDVFAALNSLRLDFNNLFSGKECIRIKELTRELIKTVVEGVFDIFNQLVFEVENEKQSNPPPLNGGVPRLVTFVTDYCHLLLDNKYKPVLVQVLSIHRIWYHQGEYVNIEGMLREQLLKILAALEANLIKWSKSFDDYTLSCLFLMNNFRYLYTNLKETKFGDVLGEEWVRGYYTKTEYYGAAYLNQSWGKLPSVLSEDGLEEFNETFEYIIGRQSRWIVYDQCLRENACRLIVQAVVPAYASLVDKDSSPVEYVKYSTMTIEALLSSMFQPNVDRTLGEKQARLMSRMTGVVVNQVHATPIST